MWALNEPIARMANAKDQCTGKVLDLPPILERLNISSREWLILITPFESKLKSLVGCKEKLMLAAKALGLHRTPAYANCEATFH